MDEKTEAYLRGKIEGSYEILLLLKNIVNSQEVTGREEIIKYLVESLERHYQELLEVFPYPNDTIPEKYKKITHKELLKTAEDLLNDHENT